MHTLPPALRRFFGTVVCASILLAALSPGIDKPALRLSPAAAACRSEELVRKLTGCPASLKFYVERAAAAVDSRSFHTIWLVECADASGDFRAYLTWDAHTGELMSISNRPRRLRREGLEPFRSAMAIQAARGWMNVLDRPGTSESWRAQQPAERSGDVWFIRLRRGDRRAAVVIRGDSGDLALATISSRRRRAP